MKINRNNYESYFLLYVDDELSVEEKTEVEQFLLKNADLSEEFDLLLDTKISDDDLSIFEHKELLYQSTSLHIDTENCEEWFLQYTDNELSNAEKESVNRWVTNHPTYKPILNVLLNTRIPKENIVFSNKELLYKHEAHRIVSLAPDKWMAAASIAILLTVGWFLWNSNNPGRQNLAAVSTIEVPKQIEPTTATKKVKSETVSVNNSDNTQGQTLNTTIEVKTNNKNKSNLETKEQYVNVKENIVNNSIVTNNSDNTYESILVEENNTAVAENNSTIAANNLSDEAMNETINTIVTAAIHEKVQSNTVADVALLTNVSNTNHYTVLQTNDDKNNLYVGALNLNKNKLKGIIRKAGKIFSDKTKNIADINADIINSTTGSIKK